MPTELRARRIGITMRSMHPQSYREPRDALARHWEAFFATVLPEALWLPVPNLGSNVCRFAEQWQLDGVVLSGGEDLGACAARDRTERALLQWCVESHRPVFGVCRGLQLLQRHFGGRLYRIPDRKHVARTHAIDIDHSRSPVPVAEKRVAVNSFHGYGIRMRGLAAPLRALATTDDGYVEAAVARAPRLAGVMWHPERERHVRALDLALVRWVFGYHATGAPGATPED